MSATALESVMRRDRVVVAAGAAVIALLAWLHLLVLAAGMDHAMHAMTSAELTPWSVQDVGLTFVMWVVMMVAMMVPSAAPVVLLFAVVQRKRLREARPYAPTGVFVAGYLAVWTAFAAAATALQWGLEHAALMASPHGAAVPIIGGPILIAAGIYQWTPLKHACVRHCRSPIDFVARHWRPGALGAFRMGAIHGVYCLGCCWLVMALLFAGGVMNLLWVAAIALFVLIEKVATAGVLVGRIGGAALVLWGVLVLIQP